MYLSAASNGLLRAGCPVMNGWRQIPITRAESLPSSYRTSNASRIICANASPVAKRLAACAESLISYEYGMNTSCLPFTLILYGWSSFTQSETYW